MRIAPWLMSARGKAGEWGIGLSAQTCTAQVKLLQSGLVTVKEGY